MRATDLQGLPRNGALARQTDTANASSATAVAPKRSTTRRKSRAPLDPVQALPAQKLAPFTATEIQAIDTQMWPVHSVVWLQPELRPEAPRSSTLRIERHYKVPAPDFLYFDVPPTSHPDTLEPVADPLPPGVQPQLPQSDLVPLGWDPRSSSGSGASAPSESRSGIAGGPSPNMRLNGEQHRNGSGQ
jgi:hypothetical protein